MAQRVTWSVKPMQQTEVDRTLARIGLAGHDPVCWEALHWFVEFSQRDLDACTEGDWHLLTEEVQALLHLITYQQWQAPLGRDDLRTIQTAARAVLLGLVDNHEASIGPFTTTIFIRRGAGRPGTPSQVKRFGPITAFPSGSFAGHLPPADPNGLTYHLACLLMRFPDVVQRCPHSKCKRLFARFRRHAIYCSRQCQSVVAAQEHRDEERRKKAESKKQRVTKKNKKGVR